MIYINLIVLLTIILFAMAYVLIRNSYIHKKGEVSKLSGQMVLFLLLASALVIRVICSFYFQSHKDLGCFEYWGNTVYKYGFGDFYAKSSADYPPGYIYILWFLTFIKNLIKVKTGSSVAFFIIKLVPMICDIATGLFLYKLASKKFKNIVSYAILFVYLFNPGVIMNSAVWGQVDSVFTLGILLMCYFAVTDKSYLSYVAYATAILIKPQAIMFTPIIMFVFAQQVFISNDGKKFLTFRKTEFLRHMAWIVTTLCGFAILSVPYGFARVIKQYSTTMGSYKYASVNAYNMWSMFGLNWALQTDKVFGITYQQWGTIVIVAICMISVFMWLSNLKDKNRYVAIAIFICAAMFTFAVRMHERYVYPAIILLMLLFILTKQVSVLGLYFAYTIAHFYNAADVLYFYDHKNFNPRRAPLILIGLLHVILFVFLYMYIHKNYLSTKVADAKNATIDKMYIDKEDDDNLSLWDRIKNQFDRKEVQRSKKYKKFTKKDWIILSVITVIYSFFALYNLGDMKAPEKMWVSKKAGTKILIELDKKTYVENIAYYNGYYAKVHYNVYIADKEYGKWTYISPEPVYKENVTDEPDSDQFGMSEVFCWNKWDINQNSKYIEIEVDDKDGVIGELVIVGKNGKIITPKNVKSKKLKGLFDEQDKYPKNGEFSYRNSTYFDEIYHARTAYEFIHGLTTYEWTHPPLGKIFISLGVRMFGMCPFGWRIIGTIFGILMVPLMYLFGKRLFNKTSMATLVCIMFTFDFMHFAQTRIATIDVYVTFFVILMYYFMYKYYEMSFYDTKLWKTFIPLGLCGVSMGLGIASKWTGCYAAVGLAIIFFYTVFKRAKEYRYAKGNTEGETNGIKHEHIVKVFKPYLVKTILFCCLVFLLIPFIIYTMSYIPFVGDEMMPQTTLGKMLYNQKDMFNYHTQIKFEHGFSSKWYEWPLMIRPIFYYSGRVGKYSDGLAEGISSFGNPLVWWLGIAAFIYVCYRLFSKKDRFAWFFFVGYLAQLLPWVLVERLTFIYHYFPSVPFVVLMNAYMLYNIIKDNPGRKKIIYLYGALVIVAFLMFYPVLSGQPISIDWVKNGLRWVNSWVLIGG